MREFDIDAESLRNFKKIERGNLTVWEIIAIDQSPAESVAIIHLDGRNLRVNNPSDACYEVLRGKAVFRVWNGVGEDMRVLMPGDIIEIPAGTPYEDYGYDVWMMSVNRPAYDAARVRILE